MTVVLPPPDLYQLQNEDQIITPALLIYPEIVETNIRIAIGMAGGDPRRWRPHIKTAKIPYVIKRLIAHGVVQLKCSTTLELLTACQAACPAGAIVWSGVRYAGQSTVFLVLERQTALTTARGNELRAQTELNKAIADLQRATGNALEQNRVEIRLK